MMMALEGYVQRSRHTLRKWAVDPRVHLALRMGAYITAGFLSSAASLRNLPMPLALGLLCGCNGWGAVLTALGGSLGYLAFWGSAGWQGVAWLGIGLAGVLVCQSIRHTYQTPFLLPALVGFIVSATGVAFQALMADRTPVLMYLLRVALAGGSGFVFARVAKGRDPIPEWIAWGFAALALGQLAPVPWLNFGYILAGALAVTGAFPAAALAGLGLDLADITAVSMTAALCAGYLIRFLPRYPRWLGAAAPAMAYCIVMSLSGRFDLYPVLPLLVGGTVAVCIPSRGKLAYRRGETGIAQVRLELAAGVLAQTQQLLLEAPEVPVDEDGLVERAAERACSSCPCRKTCKDIRRIAQLPGPVLHKPLLSPEEIPVQCRKSGRFLAQLHRSQEQLRSIRADRERQREYRAAVVQQFQFLSRFLQDLSDQLSRRPETGNVGFTPVTQVFGNRPAAENGDRCLFFPGVGCKYYVLLCDGMGTGLGAVQEGVTAGQILKRLLTAGYPAEHALRSLNSICALRDRAGAVTVDLAELRLDTGRVSLYKWGAAPSYLVTELTVEKLGFASPPPGLSVTDIRESVEQFSLRRGELLVMVSDGVEEASAIACCRAMAGSNPEQLASALLASGQLGTMDDATVVLVRMETGKT